MKQTRTIVWAIITMPLLMLSTSSLTAAEEVAKQTTDPSSAKRYEANWESLNSRPTPPMVEGREVWHLHSLGTLRRTFLGCPTTILRVVLVSHRQRQKEQ